MKKIKYINWTPSIFPGFYESELYNSDMLYNFTANDELPDGEYWDFVDGGFEKYCQDLAKQTAEQLVYDLDQDEQIIKESEFVALHSPKYYNFETDKIECNLEIDWPALIKWIKSHRDDFDRYLHDNFTSYDGFVSFVPNNVSEFFINLDDDFEKLSQVMIEYYILEHLDLDLWRDHLFEMATNTIWNYIEIKKENQ